jgi:hypothetical protein
MCSGNSTFSTFKSVFVVYKYSTGLSIPQYALASSNDNEIESITRLHDEVNA